MTVTDRLELVRDAIRAGLPLHQVEMYLDWVDFKEPRTCAERGSVPEPGLGTLGLCRRQMSAVSLGVPE